MSARNVRNHAAVLLVAVAAFALMASVVAGVAGSGLLSMLPALALATLLLLKRYPGERALIARHRTRGQHNRLRTTARPRVREGLLAAAVRGTLLMARSLAVRPPPVLGAAS